MKYKINFFYKDDKHLAIVIPEEEVPKLFNDLNNSQVYRNEESGSGFWTDIRDIRYITAEEVKNEARFEKVEGDKPSLEAVPPREEDSESREEASTES